MSPTAHTESTGGVMGALRRARVAVREDIANARSLDPALRTTTDAVLNSPGLHAIWSHRVASTMWRRGGALRTPARVLSTVTRAVTGVEIHPAATIGRRCFIDHGMGVVIGETSVIGDDVLLYHGATLGGRDAVPGKRHPTIGDRVLIGAGAVILGPVTIGSDARIGAGAVVIHDVPDGATAVGVAAEVRIKLRDANADAPDRTASRS